MIPLLSTPILEEGEEALRSINFFNGRLLSGEDLSQEQDANRKGHQRLGRAIGEGIAYGLEVSENKDLSTKREPVVTINGGLAVNRCGQTIWLADKKDLLLKEPSNGTGTASTAVIFADCDEAPPTVYVAGAGVYLLTISPLQGGLGRAPVSGLGNNGASCNTRYLVEGVRFRMSQLDLTAAELNDAAHLRNRIAYKCFGTADLKSNPFGTSQESHGLLDSLRPNRLTDCDVPLAVLHWTADTGITYIDLWSVRRRLIDPAVAGPWSPFVGDRRLSEAEAAFLQFQSQLTAIRGEVIVTATLKADARFLYLPPAGYLPVGVNGLNWKTFLGPHAPPDETLADEGLLRFILRRAFFHDPIKVNPFAEALKAGQAPPVPVDVYRVPSQNDFVVFARSMNGRIRVFFSPAPGSTQTVEVRADSKTTNAEIDAAPRVGGFSTLPDVPPGGYAVNVAVTGFKAVPPISTEAIGGRTIDVTVNLEPQPNGQVLLTVTDLKGNSIGSSVSNVTATAGSVSAKGVLRANAAQGKALSTTEADKWLIDNLAAGTYTITVVAANYQTGTLSNVAVSAGQVVQRTIALAPAPQRKEPSPCVSFGDIKRIALQKVRLCLVLETCGSPQIVYSRDGDTVRLSSKGVGTRSKQKVDNASLLIAQASAKSGKVAAQDGAPWADMNPIEPLPSNVQKWLAEWREWLDDEFPNLGIGRSTPTIFMNPKYAPPKSFRDVPDDPQAYAVFGSVGVPVTISSASTATKRSVSLDKADVKGLGSSAMKALADCGILNIDQLANAWGKWIVEALDRSIIYSRYLIEDAIKLTLEFNDKRLYYDGIDPRVDDILKKLGLTDDVALANADLEKLGGELESPGFAKRLIDQARDVVPPEAWSLDQIGLTPGEIAVLEVEGVTSKGEFISKASTADGIKTLGDTLGITVGAEQFVSDLKANAINQMAKDSVLLGATAEVGALPGVNATIAAGLAEIGITNMEQLEKADTAAVSNATGLSENTVNGLKANAAKSSRTKMDISLLSPVSNESATALKDMGITSVNVLATKSATEVAAAFGGDLQVAAAVIGGAQVAIGALGGQFQ